MADKTVLNFRLKEALWSSRPVREILSESIRDDERYRWLKRITDQTLDIAALKLVRQALAGNAELPLNALEYYDPCLVETNLAESSAMTDRCLAQRIEIYNLEAQAQTIGLDLILAEKVQAGDYQVSLVNLAAARTTAGLPTGSGVSGETLHERDAMITSARDARLALHNTVGGALNFFERIEFLRSIYADNMATAIRRAKAAEIGLATLYGVAPSANFPDLDSAETLLDRLVDWLRNAIALLEKGAAKETVFTRILFLGQDGLLENAQVATVLQTAGNADFKFVLTAEKLAMPGLHRLLGVSVAPSFDDAWSRASGQVNLPFRIHYPDVPGGEHLAEGNKVIDQAKARHANEKNAYDRNTHAINDEFRIQQRNSMLFPATIKLPAQHGSAPSHEALRWQKPLVSLVSPAYALNGTRLDQMALETGSMIRNASPLGEWEISFRDEYYYPNHRGVRSSLGTQNDNLIRLVDVALVMRIAVRNLPG